MRMRMRVEGELDIRYPQLSWLHNSLSLFHDKKHKTSIFINIQFIRFLFFNPRNVVEL